MAQTLHLINTLKKALKGHGLTYADIAKKIDMSEASIKRMFSEKNFTLKRLEQLCQCMDIEITDLLTLMKEDESNISQLTEMQEKEIVNDLSLLLVTVCVLNRWTLNDIVSRYKITEMECIQYLAKLDRLKIIDLLPKNKIKLLVTSNFTWIENGPIQKFFQSKVEKEFFSARFNKTNERLVVINGMLAENSNAVFQKKMEKLVNEFNDLNDSDAGLPLNDRYGTTVVMAIRQWEYGLFEHMRR
ncbi:MAG: helix-turn-helix transcriptional regulator [Proteobacteria bacterium]|nr:XRE family transcriptional regulator [Pseudomonadota bacterium]NOG58996.1 helix-turn-helix transcriptional regulator [Pseudomonadota bacterium]